MSESVLRRIGRFCRSLPETTEASEGQPVLEDHAREAVVFRVRKRSFAWYLDNHHGDGRVALWCKTLPGMQEALMRADHERFFVPPYLGRRGWIGVQLEGRIDWTELFDLIENSYRLVAPKHLVATLDLDHNPMATGLDDSP